MHWIYDSIFYHIYPLGLSGAPDKNGFSSEPVARLDTLYPWIAHMKSLGVNALYLGPVFESMSHGYDTVDYYRVDRRLGTARTLSALVAVLHNNGIRVVLDAVLNHVGRDFWAFRDVQARGEQSVYRDWFSGLRFGFHSPYGDPFSYDGWNGHYNLVKLNLRNPDVTRHLWEAVRMWIREFDIDGLRLDAADCMDLDFLRALRTVCRDVREDFWLMGEVVHGDYRKWANTAVLDSVTNYEIFKGLYSSHVDKNYFEIAYSLNRQFGPSGIYRSIPLYNFADNHDVSRVASLLREQKHLFPLYCLLFTIPGVPSIYYGSEWGLRAEKIRGTDAPLRPALNLEYMQQSARQPDLAEAIARLAGLRQSSPALKYGEYAQLEVRPEQFAFSRRVTEETMVIMLNASPATVRMEIRLPAVPFGRLVDILNPGEEFAIQGGGALAIPLWPCWARILKVEEMR